MTEMSYQQLGKTDIRVSTLCLGTMTWGEQNTEAEAHEQLDYATAQGINFIDAAEMYPVPPTADTCGLTETYLGTWLKQQKRDQYIIASKAAGPGDWLPHIRDVKTRIFDEKNLREAVNNSLRRLQTDYIDLYQLHWPARNTNFFGSLSYRPDLEEPAVDVQILATLQALDALVKEGKIRHIGLSNESAWGAMKFLEIARAHNLPEIVSVQNPYNLLNRSYEIGLAEVSHRENCGLLAYSPLAFGILSGKYLNDQWPEGARCSRWSRFQRYFTENGKMATQAYIDTAKKHGVPPTQMALAFVNSRNFVTSNIIGATSMTQLKSNIASHNLSLSTDLLNDIEAIQTRWPNPCP